MASYDLVHIHSLYLFPTATAAYYARKHRVPYIIQPHGTLDRYHRRRHAAQKAVHHWLIERRNLNHASAIHFTSRDELQGASDVGISAPGIVVPNGIDLSEFADLPE